jgi:hypothetical protein
VAFYAKVDGLKNLEGGQVLIDFLGFFFCPLYYLYISPKYAETVAPLGFMSLRYGRYVYGLKV